MKKTIPLSLTCILLLAFQLVGRAQAPNLGTAASYALFTVTGAFTNTGASTVSGDIGTDAGALTGFPPGTVTGQMHVADATSAQVAIDVVSAYSALTGVSCTSAVSANIGGQTLTPGVYCQSGPAGASSLDGNLTLDGQGNPNAVFIIKLTGALTTATGSGILLTNGASFANVYFQVDGAVNIGLGSLFRGTILANGAISLLTGAALEGRGLSIAGAINLNTNQVSNSTAAPLPVALLSFTAMAQSNQTVLLNWKTSLETNNKGFLIERSKDLVLFETVGEIRSETANNNSLKSYQLLDSSPYPGTSYYRLSQTDLNGKVTVFPAISVILRDEAYGTFPNPVVSNESFTLRLDEPESARLSFYSIDGRLQTVRKKGIQGGNLLLQTTDKLSSGVYILTVEERGQTRQHRIVVQ
ncbi:ice-binding family protein [Spirosoma sp. SC4-14]|uniref:ice-binding family protein n=1 Tax=Spirosoma sp. SC4-14 TaxID=3128900 RepID=UPI0030CF780F